MKNKQEKENYIYSLKNADGNNTDYPFERLKKGMYAFSKAVSEVEGGDFKNDFNEFVSATDEDILRLEEKIGVLISKELKAFYKKIGELCNRQDESFSVWLQSPSEITKAPDDENSEVKHSFGIIESIIENWGYDREEFQNPEAYEYGLKEEETAYLNKNFKCIGTWSDGSGTGYEASYYLIFDKQGNFGYIYYYQDEFNNTVEELRKLIKNGLEPNSLEDVLSEALKTLAKEYIDWND